MLDWSVAKMAEEFGINVTGIYADLSTSPGHYVLFVEPGEPVSQATSARRWQRRLTSI